MRAPVTYLSNFIDNPDEVFKTLWAMPDWERRGSTPRRERYSNTHDVPYVYGRGMGVREYLPLPWHPAMLDMKSKLESHTLTSFEVCFLNGYENSKDQLGWHADNSDTMDDARPIAILTLGAEREIWFRENGNDETRESLVLGHGSLCLMAAGMQDTHEHRIPKAGFECGPRISLTFRGYVL
jgi:alkylated DNA repair dioxygenase AlkB